MARFPQGLGQVWQRCNAGQRRLLAQLKRCLGDDHLVWHDLPLAPGGQRPDFLLLSPRQGLLLLTVKDWTRAQLLDADRDEVTLRAVPRPQTETHPLHGVQAQAQAMAQALRADPALVHAEGPFQGQLLFPLGWGVVCSHLRAAELAGPGQGLAAAFPAHRCLLQDDLADSLSPASFAMRLWGMFSMSYPCTLDAAQLDRVRWHLFPALRITRLPGAGPHGEAANPVLDAAQERILRSPPAGLQVVQGAVGTGKTQLLLRRALWLAEAATPTQPVLLLCAHRGPAELLSLLLRRHGADERVQVRSLPAWCREQLARLQLPAPAATDKADRLPQLLATLAQAGVQGRLQAGAYRAVLVDDAHAMDPAVLPLAWQLLDPAHASLMLAHEGPLPWPALGAGRHSTLRHPHRHTAELQQALAPWWPPAPSTPGPLRHGPRPRLLRAPDARGEAEALATQLAQAHADGLPLGQMAVLCARKALLAPIERALAQRQLPLQSMAGQRLRQMDWQADRIKLLSIEAAAGLEFPLVAVAGLQALDPQDDTLLRQAMGRSANVLLLSAHGPCELADRVQAAWAAWPAAPLDPTAAAAASAPPALPASHFSTAQP